MKRIDLRKDDHCVAGAVCPECGHVADYALSLESEALDCEKCGREFEVVRHTMVAFETRQMGVCPGCKRVVSVFPNGLVSQFHYRGFGDVCPSVGKPALQQEASVTATEGGER